MFDDFVALKGLRFLVLNVIDEISSENSLPKAHLGNKYEHYLTLLQSTLFNEIMTIRSARGKSGDTTFTILLLSGLHFDAGKGQRCWVRLNLLGRRCGGGD